MVHALVEVVLALVVVLSVALAAAAWRLSRGPMEVAWLVPLLQQQADADTPLRLTLGRAAIAWEGFRAGLDQPLDIRLADVVLTDPAGRPVLAVPRAALALSPGWLLLGRLVPRAVELDGVGLHLVRGADGGLGLDLAGKTPAAGPPVDLPSLLRALAAQPRTDASSGGRSRWSQLRRVRIADATLDVTDHRLGVDWTASDLAVDLRRHAGGGVAGTAGAALALGGIGTRLTATAVLDADGRQTALQFRLTPIDPAALARVLKPAAALAAVDAPVTLAGSAVLGPGLALARFTLDADLGAGTLHVTRGSAPVIAAQATLQGTPTHLMADLHRLVTAPLPDGPRTTISGHAEATRTGDAVALTARLDLDRVAFADLPALWPEGVGGPGTRPWITANITDGTAKDFHVELALTAPSDLSGATLTHLAGGGDGHGLTVHWLRPEPPIVQGEARLNFLSPDSLEVVATGGREQIGDDAITVRGGRVVFTGLNDPDQFADISADLAGPLPAALALLGEKRIGLLQKSPVRVTGAAGQFAGRIALTHLALRGDVRMDDLQIRTTLHLTGARLPGIAAGRDLDGGSLDLTADPDGMRVTGQARLAGIPATLDAKLDFRAGPPTQVLQDVTVAAMVDGRQFASLGLDAAGYASGTAQLDAHLALQRDHTGQATVTADLAGMTLTLDALGWRKPRGGKARAQARLALDQDGIAGLESVQAQGDGLDLAGAATFAGGRPDLVRIDRLVLGPATDLHGTVQVPQTPSAPWRADLTGSSIDLPGALKRGKQPARPAAAGAPYRIDARFDRVVLGPGPGLAAVAAHAESDGAIMRRLDLTGQTPGAQAFRITIEPHGAGRRLTGTAADAGALLNALDVIPDMTGGRLRLTGAYDDAAPAHPLTGRAEISNFRIRHAPALAKLLQAMTLYGLVDVVKGPGLGFSRLVAPFTLADDVLTLRDARAFSPSLGMTAKGRLDLARQQFDMQGTIVPAYFFNSLLGGIPLVGRLFSPERGGGLFAATYTLRGPLQDPAVTVNPLAALTPGFLRGLFGLLDRGSATP